VGYDYARRFAWLNKYWNHIKQTIPNIGPAKKRKYFLLARSAGEGESFSPRETESARVMGEEEREVK